ncbi:MAG: PQQ-like beta-propeller repeat protein, partial [Clostridium sp.]|nr:PQQ-like beta-propeller repeat protein [Clostridium sp.]
VLISGIDTEKVTQSDIIEDFEDDNLNVEAEFNGQWTRDNSIFKDGSFSFKSASIGNSEKTDFILVVNVPENSENVNLSFDYKVDTEEKYDLFKVYIDDIAVLTDSGSKDWTEFSHELSSGKHKIKFEYIKDLSGKAGTDSVYIDNLEINCGGEISVPVSGLKEIQYSLNDGPWEIYSEPIPIEYGEYNIKAKAIDNAGNESEVLNKDFSNTAPWIKSFGGNVQDIFDSVIETTDGYIAVGESYSSDGDLTGLNKGNFDGIIVKYDFDGNVVWNKNFGGSNTDYFKSVVETTDGYIAVGESKSTNGDLNGLNKGSYDGIIVKYDFDGNVVWNKNFGGSNTDYFNSVVETTDGYVAVGYSQSNDGDLTGLNKGNRDGIIVKYDFDGNVVWNKNFGGSNHDYFKSVVETTDGYVAVGYSESTNGDLTGLNKGYYDAIIVKYDFNGNVVWNKNFGGSNSDYFSSVAEADDGYIAVGYSNSTNGDLNGLNKGKLDGIIVKYDFDGNVVWNKNFGGSSDDIFNSVVKATDGYIAVGESYSSDGDLNELNKGSIDGIIVKYDFDGNVVWNKNFGGSNHDFFNSVIETTDGYIAVGESYSSDGDLNGLNKGNGDGIIVKIKDDDTLPNETITINPKEWTNESVEINLLAESKYGISYIKDFNNNFTYSASVLNNVKRNSVYRYIIHDKNLTQKVVEVEINNIDRYSPIKPKIDIKDDKVLISGIDPDKVTQSDIIEDFENANLSIEAEFNGQWTKDTTFYKDGSFSFKSASISDNEKTNFTLEVNVPESSESVNLTFDYKVDTEKGYDLFNVYVDNTVILSDSGSKDWSNFSHELSSGKHEIKFEYMKDSSGKRGTDSVYIDNLMINCAGEIAVPSSGLKEIQYSLDSGITWNLYEDPVPLNPGSNNIMAKAIDNAGNESEIENAIVQYDVLEMVFSDNNINFGEITDSKESSISFKITSSGNYDVFISSNEDITSEYTSDVIPISKLKVAADTNPYEALEKNIKLNLINDMMSGKDNVHTLKLKVDDITGYAAGNYTGNLNVEAIQK